MRHSTIQIFTWSPKTSTIELTSCVRLLLFSYTHDFTSHHNDFCILVAYKCFFPMWSGRWEYLAQQSRRGRDKRSPLSIHASFVVDRSRWAQLFRSLGLTKSLHYLKMRHEAWGIRKLVKNRARALWSGKRSLWKWFAEPQLPLQRSLLRRRSGGIRDVSLTVQNTEGLN